MGGGLLPVVRAEGFDRRRTAHGVTERVMNCPIPPRSPGGESAPCRAPAGAAARSTTRWSTVSSSSS
ncbi:MAG: hypothetical protein M3Q65_20920 [Chloroflexota bacterium]|nr:hypothetical protein [Chloroflexota bacterium]